MTAREEERDTTLYKLRRLRQLGGTIEEMERTISGPHPAIDAPIRFSPRCYRSSCPGNSLFIRAHLREAHV